jgi:hypothetical protein
MSGPDLDDVLRDLAAHAEREAVAADPARVRRLGERRRHRRYALTAAAAALVVVAAGGTVVTQLSGLTDRTPSPVASGRTAVPLPPPASPPAPTRTVGPDQLLRPADVATSGGPTLEIAPAGTGRSADEISVCVPTGLGPLRATGSVSRNFRYPGQSGVPISTVALQFADADAAKRAEQTVEKWVDRCPARLRAQGATLLGGGGTDWVDADTPAGTSGRFAVLPIYREQGDSSEEGVFESLGVTRVDDRLMLTARVVVGMDDNVSLDAEPDPADGMQAHPQFGLVTAAAERLAG